MLEIEDKTTKGFIKLVEGALKPVFSIIPAEDLRGINKILLLDECEDEEFKLTGGFYCAAHDNQTSTYIELYPPKIIDAKPFFVPKTNFSKKYSIVKMFLHELGHHKCGIKNMKTREIEADKYMLLYLKKLYGKWIYLFDFMARIDSVLKTLRADKGRSPK